MTFTARCLFRVWWRTALPSPRSPGLSAGLLCFLTPLFGGYFYVEMLFLPLLTVIVFPLSTAKLTEVCAGVSGCGLQNVPSSSKSERAPRVMAAQITLLKVLMGTGDLWGLRDVASD